MPPSSQWSYQRGFLTKMDDFSCFGLLFEGSFYHLLLRRVFLLHHTENLLTWKFWKSVKALGTQVLRIVTSQKKKKKFAVVTNNNFSKESCEYYLVHDNRGIVQ